MFRPISSLLIGIDLIKLLEKNGFFYVEDIESAPDAAAKIVDPKIIKELLKPPEALLALKYWQTEIECERVKTFINKFDNLLNGGFQCGTINEICGQRGSGKTQICFQISLSVQLPKKYGGLDGKSLYIDTRNGFSTKRLQGK